VVRGDVDMKLKRMRWSGHVARIGEKSDAYVIGRKARGKETSRKTRMLMG
jgi:hypothetical protein